MSGPDIGRFRHRLALESPQDVADGFGGLTRSYVARGTVWAAIEPSKVQAQLMAGREEAVTTHIVHLRRATVVLAGWRMRKGARLFEVLAVAPDDDASGFLSCRCREISS